MVGSIPEPDWKIFRELHKVALERFCERVLAEVEQINSNRSMTSHQRYLALYDLLQRRDEEVANAFNDMRRSTALFQLGNIQFHKLLNESEMSRFSPETRSFVRRYLSLSEG